MLQRFCLLLLAFPLALFGSDPDPKTAVAARAIETPEIDGKLNETIWIHAEPLTEFHQYEPFFNATAGQKTEVRFLYDDKAIYIGARLYDNSPDSILIQLGNRDDELNSDYFGIQLDTYSNGLDAFIFEVYASGVQRDRRRSDETFNAVWESAVSIDSLGWVAEMRIPWSALRFAASEKQIWGLQVQRSIRRSRELIQWALVPKGVLNTSAYWGKLHGLSNIDPPLRLSVTPFISAHLEHYPYNLTGISNFSEGVSGGMDLKYGINEGFTFDMTLMPDFSTVATDSEIKNLTAFETVYDEKRSFFKEGMDLFMKGNIFYTRRIGRRPLLHDNIYTGLKEGEVIYKNPDKAQLINAAKVSGRTDSNLGIGVFNAITANTYAIVKDSAGSQRNILTEPFTNYNVTVLDQGLNVNSSVYLINTNITRSHGFNNENVTASGITYFERSKRYSFTMEGKLSQIFAKNDNEQNKKAKMDLGYNYNLEIAKVKGNFQFSALLNAMDKNYNINGLGLNHRNDQINNEAMIMYSFYEPFWQFLHWSVSLTFTNSSRMSTGKNTERSLFLFTNGAFKNYLWIFAGVDQKLTKSHDYYEPRTAGRYYMNPRETYTFINFSSDYRKPFALDGGIEYKMNEEDYTETTLNINPIVRFSRRFTAQYSLMYSIQKNNIGFVDRLEDDVIFGNRELKSIENVIISRYMFRNNLSLSLWLRQYWFRGAYDKFFYLNENGSLLQNDDLNGFHDFNFNVLNVDLLFEWEFLPGSNLEIVFKNFIMNEDNKIVNNFFDNFNNTIKSPQLNSLAVRLLYYLDYQMLRKDKKIINA